MQLLFSFHVVQPLALPLRRKPLVQFSCSCKPYQDDAVCKHSLYEALKRALIRVPLLMHMLYIGRDAEAGRPKKTVAALSKQPGENPLPLPADPEDPPQRAEKEDEEDWWSDEEVAPVGDPELEMAPAPGEVRDEEEEEEEPTSQREMGEGEDCGQLGGAQLVKPELNGSYEADGENAASKRSVRE